MKMDFMAHEMHISWAIKVRKTTKVNSWPMKCFAKNKFMTHEMRFMVMKLNNIKRKNFMANEIW